MDYTNIIIASCTVVATVISLVKILANQFDKINKRFDKIDAQFEELRAQLKSIDQRLSRLEGAFLERGQWEGRLYSMQRNIAEEKK